MQTFQQQETIVERLYRATDRHVFKRDAKIALILLGRKECDDLATHFDDHGDYANALRGSDVRTALRFGRCEWHGIPIRQVAEEQQLAVVFA